MKRLIGLVIAAVLASTVCVASAASLVLGPGDVVRASVYGSPDLAIETRISESGAMTFPLLGEVQVGGLTTQQAEQKIGGLLEKNGYLKKAQVNLLVTTLTSQQVSVLGQVNRPGRYPVDGPRKVLDMLAVAGGVGPDGGDRVDLVRNRDGVATRETIDVVDIVRKGELNRDYEVSGGDIIFVERAPRAYVMGEVQRPGPLRIERAMTVQQAIAASGGLTPRGTQRGLRITRRDAGGASSTSEAKLEDAVQAEDVITVKESWF
ncbi:polysaccharide export protein EpsE [Telluria beijingensis]|uniref:polysaccharide export protein EpsE n=1 Tax=Telluria beijingensis TaxID=3068633 RepID=UPI0027956A56|nr:polysaccharide export protein EpsE [Massilia sp. REN29]